MRWYVGRTRHNTCEAFQHDVEPVPSTHPQYLWVLGPFHTKRGAHYCASHPFTCLTVSQFEHEAKVAYNARQD